MEDVLSYYVRMLSDIDFAGYKWMGVSIIHAFLGLLVCAFLLTLASLVLRARPKAAENRFMALMLTVEGVKAIVTWWAVYPFEPSILPIMVLWRPIWYYCLFLSVLMYLSMSAFYPVRLLGFMTD